MTTTTPSEHKIESWTPELRVKFGLWVEERFPNESAEATNSLGEAWLEGRASRATPPQVQDSEVKNIWREAVLDECVVSHMPFHEDSPRKTIQGVIEFHVHVALDPRVSERAQKLLDTVAPTVPAQIALQKAAQAVLDRWDSSAWDWHKEGHTGDLMYALRQAIAQPVQTAEQVEIPTHGRWKHHCPDLDYMPTTSTDAKCGLCGELAPQQAQTILPSSMRETSEQTNGSKS